MVLSAANEMFITGAARKTRYTHSYGQHNLFFMFLSKVCFLCDVFFNFLVLTAGIAIVILVLKSVFFFISNLKK